MRSTWKPAKKPMWSNHIRRRKSFWLKTFPVKKTWHEQFPDFLVQRQKGRFASSRYYQETAVESVLKRFADKEDRILLTLADRNLGKPLLDAQSSIGRISFPPAS